MLDTEKKDSEPEVEYVATLSIARDVHDELVDLIGSLHSVRRGDELLAMLIALLVTLD
jgi:hypothetical protein